MTLNAALSGAPPLTLVTSNAALAEANGLQPNDDGMLSVPSNTSITLESEATRTYTVRADRNRRIELVGSVVEFDGPPVVADAMLVFGPNSANPEGASFLVGDLPEGEMQVQYTGMGTCGDDGGERGSGAIPYTWTITAVIEADGDPGP